MGEYTSHLLLLRVWLYLYSTYGTLTQNIIFCLNFSSRAVSVCINFIPSKISSILKLPKISQSDVLVPIPKLLKVWKINSCDWTTVTPHQVAVKPRDFLCHSAILLLQVPDVGNSPLCSCSFSWWPQLLRHLKTKGNQFAFIPTPPSLPVTFLFSLFLFSPCRWTLLLPSTHPHSSSAAVLHKSPPF